MGETEGGGGSLPSEIDFTVLKHDGSVALAGHNGPVVDQTPAQRTSLYIMILQMCSSHSTFHTVPSFCIRILDGLRWTCCLWSRAKRLQLVCASATHLFIGENRGHAEKTSDSNVTQWAAGEKRIQIKHQRPGCSCLKQVGVELEGRGKRNVSEVRVCSGTQKSLVSLFFSRSWRECWLFSELSSCCNAVITVLQLMVEKYSPSLHSFKPTVLYTWPCVSVICV